MIRLPISLSKKYQVNQVNHEVGKKHHKHSTYNKPNILILIKIPCKYLVIIPPFPKVIPPCKYLVNHLFLLMYAITTKMANIMITIMCIGMPNKWENHFICVMPAIVIMIPKIIQVIAILSLRDLMIPAIPIPNIISPTIIEYFISKFNDKNKLLSRVICSAVYSNMNRESYI